jgi:hypothetical protein
MLVLLELRHYGSLMAGGLKELLWPTGELKAVESTPFDFRKADCGFSPLF